MAKVPYSVAIGSLMYVMVCMSQTLVMQWELLASLCQIQVKLIGKHSNWFCGIYEVHQINVCTLAKENLKYKVT